MALTMSSSDTKNISVQASKELVDEFDRALKKAEIEGAVELGTSRSEAIRRLMLVAIDDPSLFGEVED